MDEEVLLLHLTAFKAAFRCLVYLGFIIICRQMKRAIKKFNELSLPKLRIVVTMMMMAKQ